MAAVAHSIVSELTVSVCVRVCVCACVAVFQEADVAAGAAGQTAVLDSAVASLAQWSAPQWSRPAEPLRPTQQQQQRMVRTCDVIERSSDVTGPVNGQPRILFGAPTQTVSKQINASESIQQISHQQFQQVQQQQQQQFQQQQQQQRSELGRPQSPPRQVRKETKTTTESLSRQVRQSVSTTESAVKIADAPVPPKTFYQATSSTKSSTNENGVTRAHFRVRDLGKKPVIRRRDRVLSEIPRAPS